MAVNPNDIYYRREIVPPALHAIGPPLCAAYGVPATNFGDKGNLSHTYGYHRSRDFILHSPDSTRGKGDYSIQLGADKGGDDRWVSAFDFTPGSWGTADNRAKMRNLTKRLLDAAQAHDPRLAELREFAGTLDGKNVVTFDLTTMSYKTPFDSTHLDHLHGSVLRGMAASDHSGLVAVLLGLGREATMFTAQVTGNAAIYLSDGFHYRGIPDYPTFQRYQAMSIPHSVVSTVAQLEQLCGKPYTGQTALDQASLDAVEAAAEKGAEAGAAGAVGGASAEQVEEIVSRVTDRELDEQSLGGADKD